MSVEECLRQQPTSAQSSTKRERLFPWIPGASLTGSGPGPSIVRQRCAGCSGHGLHPESPPMSTHAGDDEPPSTLPTNETYVASPVPRRALWASRAKRLLLGGKKELHDPRAFHKISLIAFLAWVGLGADGLSSSAYGPEEAFKALGAHTYLAPALAVATALTVLL